jgi:hypothetical protein
MLGLVRLIGVDKPQLFDGRADGRGCKYRNGYYGGPYERGTAA